MAVTLGTVTLSDDLVLLGLENAMPVVTSSRRTLSGRLLTRTDPTPAGVALTLEGENHFTYAQADAVQALIALGAPVTLVHHRGTFTVRITGLALEPSINYADPTSSDWLSGSISLLTV